jgi:hypothetical protein
MCCVNVASGFATIIALKLVAVAPSKSENQGTSPNGGTLAVGFPTLSAGNETARISRNSAYLTVFDTEVIDYVRSRTSPVRETAVGHRSLEARLVLSGTSFAGHRGGGCSKHGHHETDHDH